MQRREDDKGKEGLASASACEKIRYLCRTESKAPKGDVRKGSHRAEGRVREYEKRCVEVDGQDRFDARACENVAGRWRRLGDRACLAPIHIQRLRR